jgi:UPF0271 protein
MRELIALATVHRVRVGAHPGFADRENFGRREVRLASSALRQLVRSQVLSLREFGALHHVKPHGALYNLAARDRVVADEIAAAVWEVDPSLVLFGLAGSELVKAGRARGLGVAEEVFADRSYQADGSLTPRGQSEALIENEDAMLKQVLQMLQAGTVRTSDGFTIPITADTLCLHGDGPNAVRFARSLRAELAARGIEVRAFGAA